MMRVLWVVNIILPRIQLELQGRQVFSGGWLVALAEDLASAPDVTLGVAMPAPVTDVQVLERDGITYFLVPISQKNRHDVSPEHCRKVYQLFRPDVVHAHGTEFERIRTFLDQWPGKSVVSIQGLRTAIQPYATGDMSRTKMLLSGNLSEIIPAVMISFQKQRYYSRKWLQLESDIIHRAQVVIGRTTWDKAHILAIDPTAHYVHCNESLRAAFYTANWELSQINRHTLLKVNALVPLKGIHYLLEALALLKPKYPDVRLNVVDYPPNPTGATDVKTRFGYPMYVRYLIQKLHLEQHVNFLGPLAEEQMCEQLQKTHVFVLSSSIENSPNTLGEAMLLGVPCVASYVGGVPDMAADGVEALLYRNNDPSMLAYQIERIFESDALALRLSGAARAKALRTHDRTANLETQLRIYRELVELSGNEAVQKS